MFKITGTGFSGIRYAEADTPLAALTKAQILEEKHHCTGIQIDAPELAFPHSIDSFAERHGLTRLIR